MLDVGARRFRPAAGWHDNDALTQLLHRARLGNLQKLRLA